MKAFYHTQTIDGNLYVGDWDHRPVMHHYDLPVKGKRVADIGCCDAMFSAHFALRGASSVTAIDITVRENARKLSLIHGFELRNQSVYELINEPSDQFDVVFSGDMIQHLENPLGGLRAMLHSTKEEIFIVTDVHEELGDKSIVAGHEYLPYFWGPAFFLRLMQLAGWRDVSIQSQFTLGGPSYPDRTVAMYRGSKC